MDAVDPRLQAVSTAPGKQAAEALGNGLSSDYSFEAKPITLIGRFTGPKEAAPATSTPEQQTTTDTTGMTRTVGRVDEEFYRMIEQLMELEEKKPHPTSTRLHDGNEGAARRLTSVKDDGTFGEEDAGRGENFLHFQYPRLSNGLPALASTIHVTAQTIITHARIVYNIRNTNNTQITHNPHIRTPVQLRNFIAAHTEHLQGTISEHMSAKLGAHERKKINRELQNIQLIFDTVQNAATNPYDIVRKLTAITTALPLTSEDASYLQDQDDFIHGMHPHDEQDYQQPHDSSENNDDNEYDIECDDHDEHDDEQPYD